MGEGVEREAARGCRLIGSFDVSAWFFARSRLLPHAPDSSPWIFNPTLKRGFRLVIGSWKSWRCLFPMIRLRCAALSIRKFPCFEAGGRPSPCRAMISVP